jgi:hypothetical protein
MRKFTARCAAGGLAGALAVLTAGLTYAATLNQSLHKPEGSPLGMVVDIAADPVRPQRSAGLQVAQAATRIPANEAFRQAETAAEIVGRMLAPGASNPDVPLPHPDLSERSSDRTDAQEFLKGPTPYARGETGGGILGLRIPIPVNRGVPGPTTTSSPPARPLEAAPAGYARSR